MKRASPLNYDFIVVGGGHNGLIASAVLAMHGARVLLVESNSALGGESSDSIIRGVRVPRVAYALGLLSEEVLGYLGVSVSDVVYYTNPSWVVTVDGEEYFRWWLERESLELEFEKLGHLREFKEFARLSAAFNRCVRDKNILYTIDPPPLEDASEDLEKCEEGLGEAVYSDWSEGLGKNFDEDLWDLFTYPPFYNEPGFITLYFHRNLGRWGQPLRGMGALVENLARVARGKGVEILTGLGVREIVVDREGAKAVVLGNDKLVGARHGILLSTSVLCINKLVGPEWVESFLGKEERRALRYYEGVRLPIRRVNIVTEEPPSPPIRGGYNKVPIVSYESDMFWGEATYPTLNDPSLSGPRGLHAVTFSGYAPGVSVDDLARELGAASILDYEDIGPRELGSSYCNPTGFPSQIPMTRNSILRDRPLKGWGNYRTPIPKLYHGSASSHPGGEVTGIPGYNAAIRMLVDLKVKPLTLKNALRPG